MQHILDSMRDSDIRATGNSNIPGHDKQAAYGRYPRSSDSENHDQNATPRPSHPYNGRHECDDHDYGGVVDAGVAECQGSRRGYGVLTVYHCLLVVRSSRLATHCRSMSLPLTV